MNTSTKTEAQTAAAEQSSLSTGLQCLVAVAQHHGINTSEAQLRREHLPTVVPGKMESALVEAARSLNLKAKHTSLTWAKLIALKEAMPIIACLDNGNFVVVVGAKESGDTLSLAVLDPLSQPANVVFLLDQPSFNASWSGKVILLQRTPQLPEGKHAFGFRWFLPELYLQKKFLFDVAVCALTLHFLTLAVPIFIQLVIDKVLVHKGISTLYVLTIGVVIALLFNTIFSYLQQYFLLMATNRVDIRLAKRTFNHLLRLPITYFETGTTGVVLRHMQQTVSIRSFLTGRLFSTLLDASVIVIFLPVLFFYSIFLTEIVLAFGLAIAAVVLVLVPVYQARLQAVYQAEGARQALLVETIQGIRTVKCLAMESQRRREWEDGSAQSITMQFHVGKISLSARAAMSLLSQMMTVTVIALGAQSVFDQTMTVGGLIAFQMLAGRIVTPLVSIASLVHEYQEAALSVKMLGEIMNREPEGRRESGGLEPVLKGRIEFEGISFRYAPNLPPALNRLTFTIPPGKVVGVVGRSGCGKTTMTRLIQGLYPVQEGVIRFDGVDIRELDLNHLRSNIGVVLQDSFLFRGTVRQNIAITHPTASFENIVNAARMAGADEFIERLPQGYDTLLEESGSNLSGGQRQRLAIARALLTQPRILILDEAASSLDPESEAIFLNNLAEIVAGRTVLIVSHRLSTLVNADVIIVMERGQIMDAGPHQELLQRCRSYAQLWDQQTRHL